MFRNQSLPAALCPLDLASPDFSFVCSCVSGRPLGAWNSLPRPKSFVVIKKRLTVERFKGKVIQPEIAACKEITPFTAGADVVVLVCRVDDPQPDSLGMASQEPHCMLKALELRIQRVPCVGFQPFVSAVSSLPSNSARPDNPTSEDRPRHLSADPEVLHVPPDQQAA